ncbi:hypothetical protein GCM10011409_20140 [Lentibacillus populi]|uniref:HTH cro/C1-type domain-containing protein n=1 Tax=Lentibacillus populi TaxID=1827502 RepID=A0A9W5TXB7_9BACI|nr:helix-turn-helix transcriptional regulator [Lentibacillus populi]GGB42537.1 hypothetical protein GCM10011409_20140 [Lentibacillus populi]
MKFGDYIKKAREQKGLSLREAANRSGISHPYLSQLENGKTKNPNPSRKTVIKLTDGLGISRVEALRIAGYLSDKDYEAISKLKKEQNLEVKVSDKKTYLLDKLLKGKYPIQYEGEWITDIDKKEIVKFIETFIIKGDE